ncbi:Dyp-type peroxidase [Gammaproteobacteria bacterium]|nr:Dyp-type peroxidase [Gammaproteobacteria bacterium]
MSALPSQPGILADLPVNATYLTFVPVPDADPHNALLRLTEFEVDDKLVVGLSPGLLASYGCSVPGFESFNPRFCGSIDVPATPGALWFWLRHEDRGALHLMTQMILQLVGDAFDLDHRVEAFRHFEGLDLSGYALGTANPQRDAARQAALLSGHGVGIDGSSIAVVQQWLHDIDYLASMNDAERDAIFGRKLEDGSRLARIPPQAHIRRVGRQRADDQEAMLRRSMPWCDGDRAGKMFCAFMADPSAFDNKLERMIGAGDNIADSIFKFSRPLTGNRYWCPPIIDGGLDLSALNAPFSQ